MEQDITNIADIRTLVNAFYGEIRKDSLLSKIFEDKINDWDMHLEKMYRFWETILLNEHSYHGSPFPVHAPLPIAKNHFDRWVGLWQETVDSLFKGKVAEEAKWRGEKMAELFLSKILYYNTNNFKPLS